MVEEALAMEQRKFNVNDFVWAKLQGYPPWPAMVVEPDHLAISDFGKRAENIKDYYWIYFLGSQDYSWVKENALKPYEKFRDKFVSVHKKQSFKQAVSEMDSHLELKKADCNYTIEDIAEYRGRGQKRSKSQKESDIPGGSGPKRIRRRSSEHSSCSTDAAIESPTSQVTIQPRHEQFANSNWCKMLDTKNIKASHKWIGILGLGFVGQHMVRNLIKSGHKVNMWNRTMMKREQLEFEFEDSVGKTLHAFSSVPKLLKRSDIIFVCISGPGNCKQFIQQNFGINDSKDKTIKDKSVVVMTTMDPETSKNIRDMVEEKGARYLETQIQWGKAREALEDSIMLFAAGSRALFQACQSCFKAISCNAIFLGRTGYASIITLILQLMRGVMLAGLAECLFLVKRLGVSEKHLMDIVHDGNMNSDFVVYKMMKIFSGQYSDVDQSLVNMQTDMKMGLDLSHMAGQPMNITAIANEIFKHCRRLDYGKMDASIIYMRNMH